MNAEQMTLESLAETGDRLCCPDSGRELISPCGATQNSCDLVERPLRILSHGRY